MKDMRSQQMKKRLMTTLTMICLLSAAFWLSGCGGSGGSAGTDSGSTENSSLTGEGNKTETPKRQRRSRRK